MTHGLNDTDIHHPLLTDADREQLKNELDEALKKLAFAQVEKEGLTHIGWQAEQDRRHILTQLIEGRRLPFFEEDLTKPFRWDPPASPDGNSE